MRIKEILVLHHSHFDIGFTHAQPVLWELQREFIDNALELLKETQDWPGISQPRWTIEATGQVLKWLETASDDDIKLFKHFAQNKRIGISAMLTHTTPLANAEQLCRQLYPIKQLRDLFGITLNTLNQHDVNGIPWTMVDIMVDAGIELLTMAVNLHFGGSVVERPSVFWWQGPSGKKIKVMHGTHYTMFDQLLETEKNNLQVMKNGLDHYLNFLSKKNYPHEFIYLTTANAPVCYDNSPPNIDVAKLIRRWNEEIKDPVIRYVTPEQLLERINQLPEESLTIHRGDWTDYWNFGCSSNAMITKINQNTKPVLHTADMLHAFNSQNQKGIKPVYEKAWFNLNLYDEHTWGSYNSMDPDSIFARSTEHLKDALAYNARELTEYLIVHELESLAQNPASAHHQDGVLVVNSTPVQRKEFLQIPDVWFLEGKRLRTARMAWNSRHDEPNSAPFYGPVEIDPYSWKSISLKSLKKVIQQNKVKHGIVESVTPDLELGGIIGDAIPRVKHFIESNNYRLEYEMPTGRITSLLDKTNNWQILDTTSPWTFFEYVVEEPDPRINPGRSALYARDMKGEKYDKSLWQTDWRARRTSTKNTTDCRINEDAQGVHLILKSEAPGLKNLEQRITIVKDSPYIQLNVKFHKEDIRTAEATYFVFPLNLPKNWKCHFDTAGMPVELDTEQLPGASRDWVTVESFVSVHHSDKGVSLICPDAPMVQIGDFNFARKHKLIQRNENPLLLAWPLNNYWDTNFRARQPGYIELNYMFRSHGEFDEVLLSSENRSKIIPLEIHPIINCKEEKIKQFFHLTNEDFQVLHVKKTEVGQGIIVRLINRSKKETEGTLTIPSKTIKESHICSVLEENISELLVVNNTITFNLKPNQLTTIKLIVDNT
jgi:hypothetical protein